MKTIIIPGGSGLVGNALSKLLSAQGYNIIILSRSNRNSEDPNINYVKWNPKNDDIPVEMLKKAHIVINLAGRNVADKRWNKRFKQEIIESRTQSTKTLVDFFNENEDAALEQFIQVSAVGYYGADSDEAHTENSPAGTDFMANVCQMWEYEALQLHQVNNRKLVIARLGIVLSNEGGALKELAKPVKFGLGVVLGSGEQFVSWIHIYDLCKMLQYFIENQTEGTYNAVAPSPVTHKNLIKGISTELNRPLWLPNAPSFILKLILGQMAASLLGSSFVSANKIKSTGFKFKYTELQKALNDILKK